MAESEGNYYLFPLSRENNSTVRTQSSWCLVGGNYPAGSFPSLLTHSLSLELAQSPQAAKACASPCCMQDSNNIATANYHRQLSARQATQLDSTKSRLQKSTRAQ